jgi:hypothetical protein
VDFREKFATSSGAFAEPIASAQSVGRKADMPNVDASHVVAHAIGRSRHRGAHPAGLRGI